MVEVNPHTIDETLLDKFMEVPMTVHGKIRKKRNEVVIVDTHNYKGITVLDIRIYFINRKGQRIRTKKGITISVDKLDELNSILSTIDD